MSLIRIGVAALTTLAALLLSPCQTNSVESFATLPIAIVSRSLLKLMDEPTPIAQQQPSRLGAQVQNTSDIPLPDGPDRDVTKMVCDKCHNSDTWAKHHHTRDEWSAVIDDMTTRGMNASDKDLDTVLDYLSAHFAPAKKDDSAPPPIT